MKIIDWILMAVAALLAVVGFLLRRKAVLTCRALPDGTDAATVKKAKKKKNLWTALTVLGSWLLIVEALTLAFGPGESKEFAVEITAERVELFGLSVSTTVIWTWIILAVLLVLSLLFRFLVFPHFSDTPKGVQNVMETAVEKLEEYTAGKVEGKTGVLAPYMFTVAVFMISCAAVELLGVRAPTSDITLTFAMAIITFFLINYYGIRRRGIGGRIHSLATPTKMVFPIRIICDIAVPVSLACRLFGNMLGGMIVMDLLYFAMGRFGVGVPSVIGLYFNVFHPLIQAFIFITLSLTFINEAVETPGE